MAAKFFTGLPLDGPDPECVKGHGDTALLRAGEKPKPSVDRSHKGGVRGGPVPLTLSVRRPDRACDEDPLTGVQP